MLLHMKQLTVCFHYLWLTKEYQLQKSIFYRKNVFLRINYIWKMMISSTPRPPLRNISCFKKIPGRIWGIWEVSLRIQSGLEVMKKITWGGPIAFAGYLLYYWYFFSFFLYFRPLNAMDLNLLTQLQRESI